jgi:hypothetical protein
LFVISDPLNFMRINYSLEKICGPSWVFDSSCQRVSDCLCEQQCRCLCVCVCVYLYVYVCVFVSLSLSLSECGWVCQRPTCRFRCFNSIYQIFPWNYGTALRRLLGKWSREEPKSAFTTKSSWNTPLKNVAFYNDGNKMHRSVSVQFGHDLLIGTKVYGVWPSYAIRSGVIKSSSNIH